jgi:dienelactone hydrolase
LWARLGALPPRPRRLRAETISREDRGRYILERIQFDNGAGAMVPGYLVVPRNLPARGAPGLLYSHWHGDQYDNGKNELLGAGHMPVIPADALAEAGSVVLAIDAYGFGERQSQGPGGPAERGAAEELSASKLNLWLGRSLWGMIVRDDLLALDYLAARPEVDSRRLGATGISMGATRTWWLMALDERVRAGVAVGCLTHYGSLVAHQQLAAHGIYYFVPGILQDFDMDAVVALIAPRPMLFLTGDRDAGSPVDGMRAIASRVSKIYALYGRRQAFRSLIYKDVGHEYLPDMWDRMLQWMRQHDVLAPGGP